MEKKTGILNTFIRYGKLLFVFLKMSLMAQLQTTSDVLQQFPENTDA